MQTILFHGASGSGKDTQLDMLEGKVDFVRIATGEMFREMYQKGHPKGIEAHKFWSEGERVPADLTYEMLEEWMNGIDQTKPWYLVSTVRWVDQIQMLDDLLAKFNRKLELFVHFTLSEKAAIERLSLRWMCPKCSTTYHEKYKQEKRKGYCDNDGAELFQREDDKPEAISQRLDWYRKDIEPILAEYRNRGILVEIDASPSIEEINKEVLAKLGL